MPWVRSGPKSPRHQMRAAATKAGESCVAKCASNSRMASRSESSWLLRRTRAAVERGLTRAYHNVRVDAEKYLLHLRRAHGLPIASFRDVYALPAEVLDGIADQTIRASSKY